MKWMKDNKKVSPEAEKDEQTEKESPSDDSRQKGKDHPDPNAKETVIEVSRQEWEALNQEKQELKDKWMRVCAEFDNARKRFERERAEYVRYAQGEVLREFLDVLDDLERIVSATDHSEVKDENFLKGVELVMARIHDMLKRHRVTPIDAVGRPFDPHRHEIMMQEPTADHPEGTVLEEFQKGYILDDQVLRTSKVKVAVKPPEGPVSTKTDSSSQEKKSEIEKPEDNAQEGEDPSDP